MRAAVFGLPCSIGLGASLGFGIAFGAAGVAGAAIAGAAPQHSVGHAGSQHLFLRECNRALMRSRMDAFAQGSSQQVGAGAGQAGAHAGAGAGQGAGHGAGQAGAHGSSHLCDLANLAFRRSSKLGRPHGSQSFFAQPAKIGVPHGVHEFRLSLALMRASRPGLSQGSQADGHAGAHGSPLTARAEIRRAAETFMDGVPSKGAEDSPCRKSTDSREE
jgi:hypothetical protein